jgi:hypothetical protein
MSEPEYGSTTTAEPIYIQKDRPFVTSTPNPTADPGPGVMATYNAIVRRDLTARREQRDANS